MGLFAANCVRQIRMYPVREVRSLCMLWKYGILFQNRSSHFLSLISHHKYRPGANFLCLLPSLRNLLSKLRVNNMTMPA